MRNRFAGLALGGGVVSFGPCQFPTLGFVVDRWAHAAGTRIAQRGGCTSRHALVVLLRAHRYLARQQFVPEATHCILLEYRPPAPGAPALGGGGGGGGGVGEEDGGGDAEDGGENAKEGPVAVVGRPPGASRAASRAAVPGATAGVAAPDVVRFSWNRVRLFDALAADILYGLCCEARVAKVVRVVASRTTKQKPVPLATVGARWRRRRRWWWLGGGGGGQCVA